MVFDRRLKGSFNGIGSLYDSARASYPEKLINDILTIASISDGKVLDVGCGTGKATILFAQRNFQVLGVDIGEELIALARENTSQFSNASYQVSSFEEANLKQQSFDLIVSAQAWHWLDPKVAYEKAHDLLKNNGHIALFWKIQEYDKLNFLQDLKKLYVKHCPRYHNPGAILSSERDLFISPLFCNFEKREYFVDLSYDREKYAQLVSSMSWVIALEGEDRIKFHEELSNLLSKQDETFSIPNKYTLLIAKKKN
jgi:SAM-dependent methyltransferase